MADRSDRREQGRGGRGRAGSGGGSRDGRRGHGGDAGKSGDARGSGRDRRSGGGGATGRTDHRRIDSTGGGERRARDPLPPLEDLFVGAASLVHELDKRVMVVLRDGRHLVGLLRSYDQFSNIVLEDAVERHVVDGAVGDVPVGLFIIRGENIVLLGELDEEKERHMVDEVLRSVSADEVMKLERAKRAPDWDLDG